MWEGTTLRVVAADRPYGEFYDFTASIRNILDTPSYKTGGRRGFKIIVLFTEFTGEPVGTHIYQGLLRDEGGSRNGASLSEEAQCGGPLGRASLLGTPKDMLRLWNGRLFP
jgi:hypothetical protein